MARAPWSDYLSDEAGNVIAGDQYEISVYEDETTTPATLYLDASSAETLAAPRRGNPGIQAKLTVQALPADTNLTVDATAGLARGDVISLRSGANQTYVAIKTVTSATVLALATAVGGAFTYPVNTVVNGVHQTGHWRAYLLDARNYTYTYKNTATGIESARRFINTKQPAATVSWGATFNGTLNAGVTVFGTIYGASPQLGAVAEADAQLAAPAALTISEMRVRISTAQPASGSLVVTLMIAGVATAAVVTIAAGSAAGVYSVTGLAVAIAAGDLLSIRLVNNATVASSNIVGFTFKAT